jgi:virginiamycin B lyase
MLGAMVRLGHVLCLFGAAISVGPMVMACDGSAPSSAPTSVSAGLFTFFSLPRTLSDPDKIESGPDGALWLTQKIGHPGHLGRITTAGAASTVAVPDDSEPTAVTIGPDRALWYSAIGAWGVGLGRVGRVSAGNVSEVPLSVGRDLPRPHDEANAFVDSIATGPDSALWFTSMNLVGRLVPGGSMTFFPITGAEELAPIVAGPDAALWTSDVVPAIWRITTSGSIRRFGLPTEFGAKDLAFADDGALWFTSHSSPLIGRRDPSGRITTFRLADDTEGESITAGPDKAMWFTTTLAVNRITASGEQTQLELPDVRGGRFPEGITTGPDGAIWFTLRAGNRGEVGRIDSATVRRKLLVARLSDRRLRGQRGRRLRVTFHASRPVTGVLRLSRGGRSATRRSIRAKTGANAIVLRLPRRSGTFRLTLRLDMPGQSASDSTLLTVAP